VIHSAMKTIYLMNGVALAPRKVLIYNNTKGKCYLRWLPNTGKVLSGDNCLNNDIDEEDWNGAGI